MVDDDRTRPYRPCDRSSTRPPGLVPLQHAGRVDLEALVSWRTTLETVDETARGVQTGDGAGRMMVS